MLEPATLVIALTLCTAAQTAPVAFDDAYTTPQGDNLSVDDPGVLDNDQDADGDPLTAVLVSPAQQGGLLTLLADGSFEYEPGTFLGVESFTYKANDGTQDSNPATITFTVTAGTTAIEYTNEAAYLSALSALGYTAHVEGFEDDAVWGVARSPITQPSVTSQGISWSSDIGSSQVTTGPGPALQGSYGFFALPHGDYLAGPQCLTPGVCTDRWNGTSVEPLVAIGGWIKSAGQGKVNLILDADEANPFGFGGGHVSVGHRFLGVIAPAGFTSFEFRELEGTSDDAVYLFGDRFTFARATAESWTDLGQALGGTHGNPALVGTGTLVGGDPMELALSNALAGTTAWIVVGFAQVNAPFKGGILVPDVAPPAFVIPLPTDVNGELVVGGTWPGGIPSGFATYFQYWIQDPAGPLGFSASNAIVGTTP